MLFTLEVNTIDYVITKAVILDSTQNVHSNE